MGYHRKKSACTRQLCLPCCLLLVAVFLALPIPAQNELPSVEDKVIYGTDDRIDVYVETDPERRAWADAVCALVRLEYLHDNQDGTYSLLTEPYRVGGKPPCPGEPFATQPTAAFCSGFMAASDVIVTAGHCLSEDTLSSMVFVFGFDMIDYNLPRLLFDSDQVYFGVEVIAYQYTPTLDFAVVLMDRDITAPGAQPLVMRQSGEIAAGTPVGVIGHPTGLPKKLAFGTETYVRKTNAPFFFYANVDAFSGNSGSPVFNIVTGLVEGILVRGNKDFEVGQWCFQSYQMSNTAAVPEAVTRSTTFASFVDAYHLPPDNDHCEDAIVIHANEYYLGSTRSGTSTFTSSCGRNDSVDVWFRFVPAWEDDYLISLCESDFDTTLALYKGSCGALEEIACSDNDCEEGSRLCLSLEKDEAVYIRVAGNHGKSGSYLLEISSDADCSQRGCGSQEGSALAGMFLMTMAFMAVFVLSVMKSMI